MKKVLVLGLTILLLLSLTACSAKQEKPTTQSGNTPTVSGSAPTVLGDAPTFTVEGASVKPGDTFTVAVRTENNPGIISYRLALDYDNTVLELIEATEQDFEGTTFGPIEKDPFVILWVDAVHPDNATNGVVANLTFRVRDDASLGDTKLSLSYDQADVFNAAWEDVFFETLPGYVTVEG